MNVEAGVRSRLAVVCHLWGGLNPMNVWDMAWGDWRILAAEADAWQAKREAAAHG